MSSPAAHAAGEFARSAMVSTTLWVIAKLVHPTRHPSDTLPDIDLRVQFTEARHRNPP